MNPRLRFKQADGTDYPDWEEKNLGDICKTFSGGTPRTGVEEYYNGNINFIRSGEIHNSKTELFISEEGLKNSSAKLVNVGDILLALYGATSGEIDLSKINGAINQAILCIRPQEGFNKKFIVESFRYNKNNILKFYLQGGQGNLSAQNILKLEFPFPCLEEQEKIADCLSSFDNLISIYNEQLKTLQEQKKGVMQKIFSQKVRFKKSDGTNYPDWEEKKLTDYLEFKNGINANRDSFGTGIKLISVSDILNNDYITYDVIRNKINIDEKTKQLYEVNYGDILFQRCSETLEEAGSANVYLDTQKAVFGGFVIRGKKIGEYNPIFFNHLLKSSSIRMEIKKKAQGAQHINIGQDLLSTINFFIPCLEEQQKIADCLSAFDEAIKIKKEQIKTAKELKKGLLQQMFV